MTSTPHKNSIKNITLSNLIKILSSYKLCTGVENKIAKKSSTSHTVPHKALQHQPKYAKYLFST